MIFCTWVFCCPSGESASDNKRQPGTDSMNNLKQELKVEIREELEKDRSELRELCSNPADLRGIEKDIHKLLLARRKASLTTTPSLRGIFAPRGPEGNARGT